MKDKNNETFVISTITPKVMHFCLFITTLSIFVLFTAAYLRQKYKENTLLSYRYNNG